MTILLYCQIRNILVDTQLVSKLTCASLQPSGIQIPVADSEHNLGVGKVRKVQKLDIHRVKHRETAVIGSATANPSMF